METYISDKAKHEPDARVQVTAGAGWQRRTGFRKAELTGPRSGRIVPVAGAECGLPAERQVWNETEGAEAMGRYKKYVALILLVGAGLLLWPAGSGEPQHRLGQNEASTGVRGKAENLQAEIEEILGQIQGVGTVRVLLTMDTDGETSAGAEYGAAIQRQYGGAGGPIPEFRKRCCWTGRPGGIAQGTQTAYPTYRGALVVCQGGDRAT